MKKFQQYLPTMKSVKINNTDNLKCQIEEIKLLKSKKEICFKFKNFEKLFKFSSEFLRVYSPSIESIGGGSFDKRLVFYLFFFIHKMFYLLLKVSL